MKNHLSSLHSFARIGVALFSGAPGMSHVINVADQTPDTSSVMPLVGASVIGGNDGNAGLFVQAGGTGGVGQAGCAEVAGGRGG